MTKCTFSIGDTVRVSEDYIRAGLGNRREYHLVWEIIDICPHDNEVNASINMEANIRGRGLRRDGMDYRWLELVKPTKTKKRSKLLFNVGDKVTIISELYEYHEGCEYGRDSRGKLYPVFEYLATNCNTVWEITEIEDRCAMLKYKKMTPSLSFGWLRKAEVFATRRTKAGREIKRDVNDPSFNKADDSSFNANNKVENAPFWEEVKYAFCQNNFLDFLSYICYMFHIRRKDYRVSSDLTRLFETQ